MSSSQKEEKRDPFLKKKKKEKKFKRNVHTATWKGSDDLSDKNEQEEERAN